MWVWGRTWVAVASLALLASPVAHAWVRAGACARGMAEIMRRVAFFPPEDTLLASGAYLLDTNIVGIMLREGAQSPQGDERRLYRQLARLLGVDREHGAQPLWVTEGVAQEVRNWIGRPRSFFDVRRAQVPVHRDAPAFQSLIATLTEINLGGRQGQYDRIIVAEAFYSAAEAGGVPTFVTMDRKIYNALCRLSELCMQALSASPVALPVLFPHGFEASLVDALGVRRRLRVLPISAESEF